MNGKIFGFSLIRRSAQVDALLSDIRSRARQLEARSDAVLQAAKEGAAVQQKNCPRCETVTPHCGLSNGLLICGLCGTEHS